MVTIVNAHNYMCRTTWKLVQILLKLTRSMEQQYPSQIMELKTLCVDCKLCCVCNLPLICIGFPLEQCCS